MKKNLAKFPTLIFNIYFSNSPTSHPVPHPCSHTPTSRVLYYMAFFLSQPFPASVFPFQLHSHTNLITLSPVPSRFNATNNSVPLHKLHIPFVQSSTCKNVFLCQKICRSIYRVYLKWAISVINRPKMNRRQAESRPNLSTEMFLL